ncbi:uncharacterized protein PAF06_019096, partial [Gastrophryne carolinensis]
RTGGKRPARHTMVTQRSPVLASLVPLAKEKSQYLFHYHELHPKVSVGLPGSEPESCPDISAPSPQSPPRPTTTTGHRSRVISRATTEAAYSMDSD